MTYALQLAAPARTWFHEACGALGPNEKQHVIPVPAWIPVADEKPALYEIPFALWRRSGFLNEFPPQDEIPSEL